MTRKRALVLFLLSPLLVLIAGSTAYLASRGTSARAKAVLAAAVPPSSPSWPPVPAPRPAPGPDPAPVLIEHKETVRRGRTFAEILERYDFTDADVQALRRDVDPVYNTARLAAGHELRFFVDGSLSVRRLEYDIDENTFLSIRRTEGGFAAEVKPFPFEVRPAVVWGSIENTPIGAFNKSGESDALAMDFAEIFAWDVDFYLDTRRGDRFALVVQKKYLGGKFMSYGDILAAEYVNAGKLFQAVRYTCPGTGKSDYFDAQGGSMRKEFMKTPLKYTRITSRFTASRFHPILKIYTSHYAVDFAAAVGTPVKATAAGTVVFADWDGGAGRMIHLRHKGGYETMYLHLSGFANGIRPNAEVASGQVIGYVGATGEATGPHLDYRILFHGKYINPLGYRFKSADPVPKEFEEDFRRKTAPLLDLLSLPLIEMRCFLAAA